MVGKMKMSEGARGFCTAILATNGDFAKKKFLRFEELGARTQFPILSYNNHFISEVQWCTL